MNNSFEARDSQMNEYLRVVKQVMGKFCLAKVVQVARGQNRHADSLTTLALAMTEDVPRIIKVELIMKPSINTVTDVGVARISVTVVTTAEPFWLDLIVDFLAKDRISDDQKEANRVRQIASRYWLTVDRKLYQRSFGGPYLLCLHPGRVDEVLIELHEGVCGSYMGRCSVAHRAMN